MNQNEIGKIVVSTAGHDFGKLYVIISMEDEYVYLVDGKIRMISHPKKKKMKHIRLLNQMDCSITEKIRNRTVKNEEIKRIIKMLQYGNSSKEVE